MQPRDKKVLSPDTGSHTGEDAGKERSKDRQRQYYKDRQRQYRDSTRHFKKPVIFTIEQEIIDDEPTITVDNLVVEFTQEVKDKPKRLDELVRFFIENTHEAMRPPVEPSEAELRARADAAERYAETKKAREVAMDEIIARRSAGFVWSKSIMPNGKSVLDCTGAEIRSFRVRYPKLFAFIIDVLHVNDDELVSTKVSADQIDAFMRS